MENNTKEYSFYELISNNMFVIEIPKVQRDYVQGRDNDHAKRVLKDLLKDIKKALNAEELPLQLQFVYGKEENGRFIPIDGQQRLTTLFLLHVYAFRNDESKSGILKKFTYETRPTSREFIQKLVVNRGEIFKEMDKARETYENKKYKSEDEYESKVIEVFKEIIVDSAWFNSLAIYDPTVLAMIHALAMIHKEFHDYEDLDKKLENCENKKVVFNYLNMNDLGMEDSLYIKLNARGKQLTKFENFKASLFERLDHIEGYTLSEKNEILSKFDNTWTDIFWQLCLNGDNQKESFDIMFERFFKILLTNLEILKVKDETSGKDGLSGKDVDILDINLPEVGDKIDKSFFDTLSYLLDYLVDDKNKGTDEYDEIYNRTIAILKKDYTYEDMIFSHMIVSFIRESKGDVIIYPVAYRRWTRIFTNLIYNTTIDEENRRKRAVTSINHLTGSWMDLYQYVQNSGNKIEFFEMNQVEEERRKVRIILEEENNQQSAFTDEIHNAEKQQYFKGQIRGALYRAYDVNCKRYDINKFKNYWNVINLLFDEAKPRDGVTLCRALLCYGDYRLKVSAYKTLCVDAVSDSANTPSMKTLFSVTNASTQTYSDRIVSMLLDDLVNVNASTVADMEDALKQIIDNKRAAIVQNDWRWCLVNYKNYDKLFGFMLRRRMRNDFDEELLIRRTSSNGLNPNVFLMVIGNEIGSDATESENYPVKGVLYEHPLYFWSRKSGEWLYIVQINGELYVKEDKTGNIIGKFYGVRMIDDVVDFCKNL